MQSTKKSKVEKIGKGEERKYGYNNSIWLAVTTSAGKSISKTKPSINNKTKEKVQKELTVIMDYEWKKKWKG